jgi:hypothetical protein
MRRRLLGLGLLSLGLIACGEPPKVLPQGTLEEQTAQVHTVMRQVIRGLAAGQSQQLIEQEVIFLPSAWRKQAKEMEELKSLRESIAAQPGEIELGKVSVAGRWALLESVKVGGVLIGKQDVPWFLFYFAGQWRWMPASILKDPAIEGMMERNFDLLWGTWQAAHPQQATH